MNGEALFPHAESSNLRTNPGYPTSEVLSAIFSFAERFGTDIRERVIVRNWDDPSASTQSGVLMADLQRRLFQLVHVPIKMGSGFGGDPKRPEARQRALLGPLERRATNWAHHVVEVSPESVVVVILVGLAEEPDLPDGVSLATLDLHYGDLPSEDQVILDPQGASLQINRELWAKWPA